MSELVLLTSISPKIALDILYATPHNFTGEVLYSKPVCYLRKKTADRLHRVFLHLQKEGLGLKVFDGYRPLSIQKKLWNLIPDPRYVADPKIGSKHNRGAAVDLTLVDQEGKELSMPTAFDDFSEKAHRDYQGGSSDALFNRNLLETAMVAEGFLPLPTEWWHFDDPEWESYPILDVSFESLGGK